MLFRSEGLWICWHNNGQKQDETIYKNGVEIKRIDWYENGNKRRERRNKEDYIKHGLQIWWHENGQKTYEALFNNGELIYEKFWDIEEE